MTFLLGAFGPRCKDYEASMIRAVTKKHVDDYQKNTFQHARIMTGQEKASALQPDRMVRNNNSFFVGKIFDRQTHKSVTSLSNEPLATICKKVWGRYVGVEINEVVGQITLVRDPVGLSSLFYCIQNGTLFFATELALLYDALPEKPSVNYEYFIEHLIDKTYVTEKTPFHGIHELLPGVILSFDKLLAYKENHLWEDMCSNPRYIDNKDEFEHVLLETMKQCTAAWTEGSSGVCVELSGGTDSSGVMFLLREMLPADKKIVAVNFIDSKMPSSNEHQYAQDVADRCEASLHFIDWQDVSLLDPLPSSWRPDRPTTFFLFSGLNQQLTKLAAENGCSQIMNGQGGDHVFLSPAPLNALEDRWIEKGIRGSFSSLQELSSLYRMPWWSLLYQSVRGVTHYYRGTQAKEITDTSFIAPAHRPQNTNEFYLNQLTSSCYPAHAARIKHLFHAVAYAERNQRFPNVLTTHPLLSQPVIELAFKIPTYQSFQNGFDRIFFRKAVSKLTDSKALWRHIKGHTTGSMMKACANSADEIESLIMNGVLVKQGIINVEWFKDQLTKVRHGMNENMWPILHMITTQLWFNQWGIR